MIQNLPVTLTNNFITQYQFARIFPSIEEIAIFFVYSLKYLLIYMFEVIRIYSIN